MREKGAYTTRADVTGFCMQLENQILILGDVGNSAQGTVMKRPPLPTYFTKIESEKFIWMLSHYFKPFHQDIEI